MFHARRDYKDNCREIRGTKGKCRNPRAGCAPSQNKSIHRSCSFPGDETYGDHHSKEDQQHNDACNFCIHTFPPSYKVCISEGVSVRAKKNAPRSRGRIIPRYHLYSSPPRSGNLFRYVTQRVVIPLRCNGHTRRNLLPYGFDTRLRDVFTSSNCAPLTTRQLSFQYPWKLLVPFVAFNRFCYFLLHPNRICCQYKLT